ncbi:MAG: gliding motility lipoprotein GldH [Salibacteraceae bacterium]
MRSLMLFLCLSPLLIACSDDALVNATTPIENGDWAFEDSRKLKVEINDTLSPLNFYVLVRHGGNYAYRNLILYFKTYYPNNTYKVDTIDCPLADKSGRWFGSGLGDLLDNRIMFKRNVQLPLAGEYSFELQHAMRPDTIKEVYDIGLRIENAFK